MLHNNNTKYIYEYGMYVYFVSNLSIATEPEVDLTYSYDNNNDNNK